MLNRGEVEYRIDPFYYQIAFRQLESKVRSKQHSSFGNYVRYMAGGATPKKEGGDEYYAETGVPFLRVQNILPEGLSLDDVVLINQKTHDGLLKRSQVNEDSLLVTITGRIASSCVAPKGFIGNINQHSVVIKTDSLTDSEYLAAYLNSGVGQKLALRRTTGGTRPALDYPALKSIPVVFDKRIVAVMQDAYKAKLSKEAEAKTKLASIDGVVLGALGITLPEADDGALKKRIFYTKSAAVTSTRFDAPFNSAQFSLRSPSFPMVKIRNAYALNPRTSFSRFETSDLLSFVPMDAVSDAFGEIAEFEERPVGESLGYTRFREGDVLWAKITPCMQNGKSAIAENLVNGLGFGSTEFHVFRAFAKGANPRYLHCLLRLKSLRDAATLYFGGSAGHQRVDPEFFRRLEIPLPPPEVQAEIADRVDAIYREAKQLRREGDEILANAKAEVEKMILA